MLGASGPSMKGTSSTSPENPETLWRVFFSWRRAGRDTLRRLAARAALDSQAVALGSVGVLLSRCDAVHVDLLIVGQAARDGHFLTQIGFADGILVVDGEDVLGG